MSKTPVQPVTLVSSVGVHCHPGKVRTENQDRISRSETPFGDLYVLADGVGGQSGGAEAARSTAEGFAGHLPPLARLPVADALKQAAQSISEDLNRRGPADGPRMSSTVVLALIQGTTATIGHLGDSRAYLMRGGRMSRLTREMFVTEIVGRSMEPLIPDGSLCVFRRGVTGSRQGRLVLVEALGEAGNDRYTVKRYRSEKRQNDAGEWSHERIRLEPLNPAFEAWDLDPEEDRYRILAEFVEVL